MRGTASPLSCFEHLNKNLFEIKLEKKSLIFLIFIYNFTLLCTKQFSPKENVVNELISNLELSPLKTQISPFPAYKPRREPQVQRNNFCKYSFIQSTVMLDYQGIQSIPHTPTFFFFTNTMDLALSVVFIGIRFNCHSTFTLQDW